MEESDQTEKGKHPTKAVTSKPQEEFISEEARPSQPEHREENPLPKD